MKKTIIKAGKICITIFILMSILILSRDTECKQWAFNNNGQEINGIKGKNKIDINISALDKKYVKGNGVVIGIIDTGIYPNDIVKDRFLENKKEVEENCLDDDKNGYKDDRYGWNFYDNNKETYTDSLADYHGTVIANIIIGNDKDYLGVARNASLIPLKCFSGTEGDVKDIIPAIKYAKSQGVDIMNISWDTDRNDIELYELIKEYDDILFVCSSGNKQKDISVEQAYPASYELDNVIAVSAIGSKGKLYEYSGFGKKIDILAPGENIYCLLPESDRIYMDGTSLATAYVTGAAALLLSNYPELSPTQIREIIKKSANRMKDNEEMHNGYGILNVKGCFDIAEETSKNMKGGEKIMNIDSLYSIIMVCTLAIYGVLIWGQLKRIIWDKKYRNIWVVGGTILSGVICLLGMLTSVNMAGSILAAIVIVISLNIREKVLLKNTNKG